MSGKIAIWILIVIFMMVYLRLRRAPQKTTPKEKNMDAHLAEMKAELEKGSAQLFDVREDDEWEMGHLKDAILVPLSQIGEMNLPSDLDKSKKTYLHCRSGGRVLRAAPMLLQMGFSQVIPLKEGFDSLVAEGFEEA